MDNIFKDAYFGQVWQRRDGKKAIFQNKTEDNMYSFFSEDCAFHVQSNGLMYFEFDDDVFAFKEIHPELDIICLWEADEDGLATEYALEELGKEHYPEFGEIKRNYKAGFSKAKEIYG